MERRIKWLNNRRPIIIELVAKQEVDTTADADRATFEARPRPQVESTPGQRLPAQEKQHEGSRV